MRSRRPTSQLEAYDATKAQRLTDRDRVMVVLREAGRALTLSEITRLFNAAYGTRKPDSTISGRLNELEARGKVANYRKRKCSVTGLRKQTWFISPEADVQLSLGVAS